jgi:hypothetical protein
MIPLTYQINDAKISLKHGKTKLFNKTFIILRQIRQFIFRLVIFLFSFFVTWFVFNVYIDEAIFADSIALGAIFATLGSALVSVFTLFCGEQYVQFRDNAKIFHEQLIGSKNWERWPFVKRFRVDKVGKKQFETQLLENPTIVFSGFEWSVTIPLPASKVDFYELSIYRCFFRLKLNRAIYRRILSMHPDPNALKEILLWDCLEALYRNIVLYRVGKSLAWFGGCFVFNSIFFSFFYNTLSDILL